MNGNLLVTAALVVGLVVAVAVSADSDDQSGRTPSAIEALEDPSPYSDDSPEFQLAVIDDAAFSTSDEDEIRPYARELDLLERRCTNPRSRLADFAVNTVKQAESRNISTSNIKVLRDVRRATPPQWKRQGCSGLFALYLTLLDAG
jgi:hypothetical protein